MVTEGHRPGCGTSPMASENTLILHDPVPAPGARHGRLPRNPGELTRELTPNATRCNDGLVRPAGTAGPEAPPGSPQHQPVGRPTGQHVGVNMSTSKYTVESLASAFIAGVTDEQGAIRTVEEAEAALWAVRVRQARRIMHMRELPETGSQTKALAALKAAADKSNVKAPSMSMLKIYYWPAASNLQEAGRGNLAPDAKITAADVEAVQAAWRAEAERGAAKRAEEKAAQKAGGKAAQRGEKAGGTGGGEEGGEEGGETTPARSDVRPVEAADLIKAAEALNDVLADAIKGKVGMSPEQRVLWDQLM